MDEGGYAGTESKEKPGPAAILTELFHFPLSFFHNFPSAICSITRSLISRQPEIGLHYRRQFWKALGIAYPFPPELRHLRVAVN
jgi:hypothetical protein